MKAKGPDTWKEDDPSARIIPRARLHGQKENDPSARIIPRARLHGQKGNDPSARVIPARTKIIRARYVFSFQFTCEGLYLSQGHPAARLLCCIYIVL